MKTMKLTNVQKQQLNNLIEMTAPNWVTKPVYAKLINSWSSLKFDDDTFWQFLSDMFQIEKGDIQTNPTWKSVSFRISPRFFFELYTNGNLISSPATGQDPKNVTNENKQIAAEHAGYQWGTDDGSMWLEYGTFNLIQYPNGKVVIEPVDVEHRLWGMIGFPMGIVPLVSDKPIYFKSQFLKDGKIKVNGLYLAEIVDLANDNRKDVSVITFTEKHIKDRFFKGKFPTTILPMYSQAECHEYYRVKNSRSNKTKPQLMHARDEDANLKIKAFSSIKNHNFAGSSDRLHPFYDFCFSDEAKIKLKTFMISHLLFQFNSAGEFIPPTDKALISEFIDSEGYNTYKVPYNDVSEQSLLSTLNFLYDIFSKSNGMDPSRQRIILMLMLDKYLSNNSLFIGDKETFINKFDECWDELYYTRDEETGEQLSVRDKFGFYITNSDIASQTKAFNLFITAFLCGGKKSLKYDESIIETLGIYKLGNSLPRLFTPKQIEKSLKKYQNIDIDGDEFAEDEMIVDGHIISDFELLKMNDIERDNALLAEGIAGGFTHEKNCRAMSAYHNLRMSILRVSEYMEIIDKSDVVVRKAIQAKRKAILNAKMTVSKKKK